MQRNHFRGSGTHVTVFNGTTEQLVGMSQPFGEVEIANAAGVRFFASPPWITGRLAILQELAATFDISGTLDDALDLFGTLTTPDDPSRCRSGARSSCAARRC